MTNRTKRVLSAAAVVLVCISVFCSFIFIAGNSFHDCTHDDDCEICRIIDACISTIRGASAGSAAVTVFAVTLLLLSASAVYNASARQSDTLISLKVELRD